MIKKSAIALCVLMLSSFAQAETFKEVNVYGGYNENNTYKNYLLGAEFVPHKQLFDFVDLLGNVEYHHSEFKREPGTYYQENRLDFSKKNQWFNLGLKARKTFNNGIFVKAGVGISYVENKAYGRKITGSHWQFSPTASLGYNITKKMSVEYQWVHFSNAGTALPNPGREFHYITLGYKF